MFQLSMVRKTTYHNEHLQDFFLKLTKESINKYTKKIQENNSNKNKDTKLLINLDYDISNSNPNNPNNNPYIIISCIGIFYFVTIIYSLLKSKR
jgi:hypothetical protein